MTTESNIQDLLKRKAEIDRQLSLINKDKVAFSVDAGIINRLGKELVGRAETAVSELVKNAYDADANNVTLNFIDTDEIGGTLTIEDDGHGMSREQLINGFMRLASSDKIHEPLSPKYKRQRAGRKGIGRFSTQRLGQELTIITEIEKAEKALQLNISWNRYKIDQNISDVYHSIEEVESNGKIGTKLIIKDLNEVWTKASIKRVFRYVSELLQPDFLSDRTETLNIANQSEKKKSDNTFQVFCYRTIEDSTEVIANLQENILTNALAVIEGYAIEQGDVYKGVCEVVSKRFKVNDIIDFDKTLKYNKDIHFKIYYFIYNFEWYESNIQKMEYNKILEFSRENSGIRLYRNGFRVFPYGQYGERGDDWLHLNRVQITNPDGAHVPFANTNFFGFVEVVDTKGDIFEETASREGVLENEAFKELTSFVYQALVAAGRRVNSARLKEKKGKTSKKNKKDSPSNQNNSTIDKAKDLKSNTNSEEDKKTLDKIIEQLEEIEMLRVLAGIGLNIAEFTHEIRQFIPSFNGSINYLSVQELNKKSKESLSNLKQNFNRFTTYTTYIDSTITQNVSRDKEPLKLRKLVNDFLNIIKYDAKDLNIDLVTDFYGYDLFVCPMHPSEWSSILYNLYTNSKKAIKRANIPKGQIGIIGGKEKGKIYLEFTDNGDGIPKENEDRVFDAFFTTTIPASYTAPTNSQITGTGLGLKIVKDIINAYNGDIFLLPPESGYTTCFRIELPEATQKQLTQYGY